MKIITFNYTKSTTGETSQRVLVALVKPNTAYEGICIESLEAVDQVVFIERLNQAHNEYLTQLKNLQEEFDLKHDYRRFLPERMTNVVTEEI